MRTTGTIAAAAFAPDGKTLAFVGRTDGKWSLRTAVIRTGPDGLESGATEPFVDVPSGAATAAFSPDGRWLAYTSAESGPFEVYVRRFPDNGTKRLVSSGGGMMPMWSPNGKDIFYRSQDQRLMVASYGVKDGAFIADPPRPWSAQRLANIGMTGNVDLAPDGTRFVALMPANAAESRDTRGHYTLVTNFFDTVRRRLAAAPK
jgi:serine/threonine-protein kinase